MAIIAVLPAILFLSFSPLTVSSANADNSSNSQFEVKTLAIVDLKKIVDDSKAAKSAQEEVEKLQKTYIKEAEKEEAKLKKREEQLLKQKKALSEEAFINNVKEFQNRIKDGHKEVVKKRRILEASYLKALEMIKEETYKVVEKIAKQKNIDVVIPKSQLLFAKEGLDISDEVLEQLNKDLAKVNINVEKAKEDK